MCNAWVLFGCSSMVMSASVALAQNINLPGSVDPGRALENSATQAMPNQKLEQSESRSKAVAIAPEGMEQLRFVLQNISVEGMGAYSPAEIKPIYDQYLGQEISVATVFEIMGQLQQKYLDDGYALTKVVIPNQNIESGNVKLSVIEGHVEEVEVAPGVKRTFVIEDVVNQIASMRPLNIKKLERIMLVLNDYPDAALSAILASPKTPDTEGTGAVRLILQPIEKAEKLGRIGLDNHGSVFSGPWQTYVNLHGASIVVDHSELTLTTHAAIPFQEQKLGSLSYTIPLFGVSGARVAFSGTKALTEPGSSLSTLDIKGASESLEANLSYPIIRQRDKTLVVDGGFEWKNSRTKILGEELYDDRLRIAKAGVNFNFTDSFAGYSVLDVRYAQGLNVFGVRETGSVDLSRQLGKSDFKKFNFLAARVQALPWGLELFGLVQGQYSFDPLLSSEEFGFGGARLGRGYDSSEITGDKGVAGTLELRYRTTAPIFNTTLGLQPYAFYDVGKVWNIDKGGKNKLSAASTGAGIRFDHNTGWNADLNFATPLTRSAQNEPKYQNDVGARIMFSISKTF